MYEYPSYYISSLSFIKKNQYFFAIFLVFKNISLKIDGTEYFAK